MGGLKNSGLFYTDMTNGRKYISKYVGFRA